MKTMMLLFCAWITVSTAFAQEVSMEKPQKFQFSFSVSYNYQDSIPDKSYSLKKHQLKIEGSQHHRSENGAEVKSDSVQLTDIQLNKIKHYCEKYWEKEHYHGLCRALSPVSASIELWQKDKFVKEDYAPCRSSVLIEPFTSFQMLLEAIFAEAKKK